MFFDMTPTYDFEIISELVEYSHDREEHEGHIYPELRQVYIVSNPRLIAYHHEYIDEAQECQRSPEESSKS